MAPAQTKLCEAPLILKLKLQTVTKVLAELVHQFGWPV